MTGGYMWNNIRSPPFIARGQDGNPSYVASGFQQQHGVETVIVSGFYSVISISLYGLTFKVPAASPELRKGMFYIFITMLFVSYSGMLMFFRLKNPHYPFKLVRFVDLVVLINIKFTLNLKLIKCISFINL
jgi:oligosaccharyltransferase complex subunit gamma